MFAAQGVHVPYAIFSDSTCSTFLPSLTNFRELEHVPTLQTGVILLHRDQGVLNELLALVPSLSQSIFTFVEMYHKCHHFCLSKGSPDDYGRKEYLIQDAEHHPSQLSHDLATCGCQLT